MEEPLLWNQPQWVARAKKWITDALEREGARLTGPIEQPYLRPWSTVMKTPTDRGMLFFKAAIPSAAFEARLVPALASRSPGFLPEVVAVDAAQGFLLLRDAGQPLRSLLKDATDYRILDRLPAQLAVVQQQWANQEEELIDMGLPDHRLDKLPPLFERMIRDRGAMLVGQENGLTEEQYRLAVQAIPRYAELCARLLEYSIPQSVHYDDMHSGNVYFREEAGGALRLTFLDWGDSSVSHPFCSMLIFLRATSDLMNLPEDSTEIPEQMPPALARLRNAYLEAWTGFDKRQNLLDAFHLAWRVGMGARAVSWHESIETLPERARDDYRHYPPAWISELLRAMPQNK